MNYFTYNNQSSIDYNFMIESIKIDPLSPKLVTSSPNEIDGILDFSTLNEKGRLMFDSRIVTITAHYQYNNNDEKEIKRNKIMGWIYGNVNNQLVISICPNVKWDARLEKISTFEQIQPHTDSIIIQFRVPVYSYKDAYTLNTIAIGTGESDIIINNQGTFYTDDFKFVITGAIEDLKFTLNGKTLDYKAGITTGDSVTIDFNDWTISKTNNKITTQINNSGWTGEFFELNEGNNTIHVISNGTVNLVATITPHFILSDKLS